MKKVLFTLGLFACVLTVNAQDSISEDPSNDVQTEHTVLDDIQESAPIVSDVEIEPHITAKTEQEVKAEKRFKSCYKAENGLAAWCQRHSPYSCPASDDRGDDENDW